MRLRFGGPRSSGSRTVIAASKAIKELGLRCPEATARIGFGESPYGWGAGPPLTVIAQPTQTLGEQVMERPADLVDGLPPALPLAPLSCRLGTRCPCRGR